MMHIAMKFSQLTSSPFFRFALISYFVNPLEFIFFRKPVCAFFRVGLFLLPLGILSFPVLYHTLPMLYLPSLLLLLLLFLVSLFPQSACFPCLCIFCIPPPLVPVFHTVAISFVLVLIWFLLYFTQMTSFLLSVFVPVILVQKLLLFVLKSCLPKYFYIFLNLRMIVFRYSFPSIVFPFAFFLI